MLHTIGYSLSCGKAVAIVKSTVMVMLLAGLSACVSPPLQTDSVETHMTPLQFVASQNSSQPGSSKPNTSEQNSDTTVTTSNATVAWGGVIVNSANVEGKTQIEVLSYPLDRVLRPDTRQVATGRFLVTHGGYLETLDYSVGRYVTVVGQITGTDSATLGEASYVFPTVTSTQIHLWTEADYYNRSGIRFGIGINISN